MKPPFRLLLAALGFALLTAPAGLAAPDPGTTPKVKLTFVDTEKFTDITVGNLTAKNSSDQVYAELNRHLALLAKRQLAPGQTLVVTMRDIDLAGVIEPWRGPDFGRIRYVRDAHPPRLVFDYQLLAADGTVVQEGSARLTNLTFRYQAPTIDSGDATYFEKQLLDDWIRSTFSAPPKAKAKR